MSFNHYYNVLDLRADNHAAQRSRHAHWLRKHNAATFAINCLMAAGIVTLLSFNGITS